MHQGANAWLSQEACQQTSSLRANQQPQQLHSQTYQGVHPAVVVQAYLAESQGKQSLEEGLL